MEMTSRLQPQAEFRAVQLLGNIWKKSSGEKEALPQDAAQLLLCQPQLSRKLAPVAVWVSLDASFHDVIETAARICWLLLASQDCGRVIGSTVLPSKLHH